MDSDSINQRNSIKAIVRVRPNLPNELNESKRIFSNGNNIIVPGDRNDNQYTFDSVLDEDKTQEETFEYFKPLIQSFVVGYNAAIIAYGQTGSGKTYTMGLADNSSSIRDNYDNESNISSDGIIQRSFVFLKSLLEKQNLDSEKGYPSHSLKASFVEVYGEEINDLLTIIPSTKYDQSMFTNRIVNTLSDLRTLLADGARNRKTAATAMNDRSSRSHAILRLTLEQGSLRSVFSFVDLAGSERANRAQTNVKSSNGSGSSQNSTFQEGVNINMGLLAFSKVISALSMRSSHIPYRDSVLTYTLKDCLGGNSLTSIIACISSTQSNAEESGNTIKYAARARNIQNTPVQNYQFNDYKSNGASTAAVQAELSSLREQVLSLSEERAVAVRSYRETHERLSQMQILNDDLILLCKTERLRREHLAGATQRLLEHMRLSPLFSTESDIFECRISENNNNDDVSSNAAQSVQITEALAELNHLYTELSTSLLADESILKDVEEEELVEESEESQKSIPIGEISMEEIEASLDELGETVAATPLGEATAAYLISEAEILNAIRAFEERTNADEGIHSVSPVSSNSTESVAVDGNKTYTSANNPQSHPDPNELLELLEKRELEFEEVKTQLESVARKEREERLRLQEELQHAEAQQANGARMNEQIRSLKRQLRLTEERLRDVSAAASMRSKLRAELANVKFQLALAKSSSSGNNNSAINSVTTGRSTNNINGHLTEFRGRIEGISRRSLPNVIKKNPTTNHSSTERLSQPKYNRINQQAENSAPPISRKSSASAFEGSKASRRIMELEKRLKAREQDLQALRILVDGRNKLARLNPACSPVPSNINVISSKNTTVSAKKPINITVKTSNTLETENEEDMRGPHKLLLGHARNLSANGLLDANLVQDMEEYFSSSSSLSSSVPPSIESSNGGGKSESISNETFSFSASLSDETDKHTIAEPLSRALSSLDEKIAVARSRLQSNSLLTMSSASEYHSRGFSLSSSLSSDSRPEKAPESAVEGEEVVIGTGAAAIPYMDVFVSSNSSNSVKSSDKDHFPEVEAEKELIRVKKQLAEAQARAEYAEKQVESITVSAENSRLIDDSEVRQLQRLNDSLVTASQDMKARISALEAQDSMKNAEIARLTLLLNKSPSLEEYTKSNDPHRERSRSSTLDDKISVNCAGTMTEISSNTGILSQSSTQIISVNPFLGGGSSEFSNLSSSNSSSSSSSVAVTSSPSSLQSAQSSFNNNKVHDASIYKEKDISTIGLRHLDSIRSLSSLLSSLSAETNANRQDLGESTEKSQLLKSASFLDNSGFPSNNGGHSVESNMNNATVLSVSLENDTPEVTPTKVTLPLQMNFPSISRGKNVPHRVDSIENSEVAASSSLASSNYAQVPLSEMIAMARCRIHDIDSLSKARLNEVDNLRGEVLELRSRLSSPLSSASRTSIGSVGFSVRNSVNSSQLTNSEVTNTIAGTGTNEYPATPSDAVERSFDQEKQLFTPSCGDFSSSGRSVSSNNDISPLHVNTSFSEMKTPAPSKVHPIFPNE